MQKWKEMQILKHLDSAVVQEIINLTSVHQVLMGCYFFLFTLTVFPISQSSWVYGAFKLVKSFELSNSLVSWFKLISSIWCSLDSISCYKVTRANWLLALLSQLPWPQWRQFKDVIVCTKRIFKPLRIVAFCTPERFFHWEMDGSTCPCQCLSFFLFLISKTIWEDNRGIVNVQTWPFEWGWVTKKNVSRALWSWQAAMGLTQLCVCSLHQSQTLDKFSSPFKKERKQQVCASV